MRSRQKILNATLELIETSGFEGVNIAAVAHAAGVSRQTVYSIFGSREEVVSQAMAGLVFEIFADMKVALAKTESARDYVVELIVAGRAEVRAHRVLTTLLVAEHGNPVFDAGMMARAKPVAGEFLAPLVERNLLPRERMDDVVEMSIRLGLSVITFDSEALRSDDELRAFLDRWLGPALA